MYAYILATLSSLTANVQDDLHDPSFSSTRIHRYLNHGQKVIFNTHMFRFCEKLYTGTLANGAYSMSQQSDHQVTVTITLIDPDNTNRTVTLNRDNFLEPDIFFERYPYAAGNTAGMPTEWTEYGGTMYFSCPADKEYTFVQRYYREPTDMSSDSSEPDVPSGFTDLLELWADYRSEKYRGNHDIAATYKQEFEDGLETMVSRYALTILDGPAEQESARSRINYGSV